MIPLFLLALILAGIYTVTFPGNYFVHYLFGPLLLLFAFLFSRIHTLFLRMATVLLMTVFMSAFSYRVITTASLNPFATEKQGGWVLPQTTVTNAIAKYVHRGEGLAV